MHIHVNMPCAGCDNVLLQNLSYGFLTHHHGTFFFARTAEHMYAITDAVLWSQEGPGVIAHLTCELLYNTWSIPEWQQVMQLQCGC